jgi:hypothetical protein
MIYIICLDAGSVSIHIVCVIDTRICIITVDICVVIVINIRISVVCRLRVSVGQIAKSRQETDFRLVGVIYCCGVGVICVVGISKIICVGVRIGMIEIATRIIKVNVGIDVERGVTGSIDIVIVRVFESFICVIRVVLIIIEIVVKVVIEIVRIVGIIDRRDVIFGVIEVVGIARIVRIIEIVRISRFGEMSVFVEVVRVGKIEFSSRGPLRVLIGIVDYRVIQKSRALRFGCEEPGPVYRIGCVRVAGSIDRIGGE